ncbi:hypothetical protein SAMN02745129_2607 [Ferrimonas marina]|uniref:Uncharacterized protein n=2 Tax=Ferrimonas marina TaxID=299255 RepID=A0A1M5UK52_9GAMM|nr:hypothetical protein SAMN02745129_2607 [Ferrimonas marina]
MARHTLTDELSDRLNLRCQSDVLGRGRFALSSLEVHWLPPGRDLCDYPTLLAAVNAAEHYGAPQDGIDTASVESTLASEPLDGKLIAYVDDGAYRTASIFALHHYLTYQIELGVGEWLDDRYPVEHSLPATKPQHSTDGSINAELASSNPHADKIHASAWVAIEEVMEPLVSVLLAGIDRHAPRVYQVRDGRIHTTLIVRNDQTMTLLRPAHLIEDLNKITGSYQEVDSLCRRGLSAAVSALVEQGF